MFDALVGREGVVTKTGANAGILFAAMTAPIPVPQTCTARLASPLRATVDHLVAERFDNVDDGLLPTEAGVVDSECDPHQTRRAAEVSD